MSSPTSKNNNNKENLLKALIENLVEKSFGSFNLREFKNLGTAEERVEYARKTGLRELGSGSSRTAFAISSSKVLKIGNRAGPGEDNGSGRASEQNKQEVLAFLRYEDRAPGAFAEIYDYEPKWYGWVIAEPVQGWDVGDPYRNLQDGKMASITGGVTEHVLYALAPIIRNSRKEGLTLDVDALIARALGNYQKTMDLHRKTIEQGDREGMKGMTHRAKVSLRQVQGQVDTMAYLKNHITPRGREMLEKFAALTRLGFTDIDRPDHWGVTASGRVVCLDYGIQDMYHLAGD